MITSKGGSTASLTFNGTAVWLYAESNGYYRITLDDVLSDGGAANNGSSILNWNQQPLFEAKGLDGSKVHRLTVENLVTNDPSVYLAIDSVSGAAYPIVSRWGVA